VKIIIRFQDTVSVVDAVREAAYRHTARRDGELVAEYRARIADNFKIIREHLATWIDGSSVSVEFDLAAGRASVVPQAVPEQLAVEKPAAEQSAVAEEQPSAEKVADFGSRGKY
jgi:hypothetical protein